jgi:pantothenate synthetase
LPDRSRRVSTPVVGHLDRLIISSRPQKLAEEEKRTEVERHIERAKQATRRAESAEDNLANARALAQTAKSAQKETTTLKKEKEQCVAMPHLIAPN